MANWFSGTESVDLGKKRSCALVMTTYSRLDAVSRIVLSTPVRPDSQCRGRMPVRRRFQHRINSVTTSPHSPSLFLLCDRGRLPSCPHRGRTLTRVHRDLWHKLRAEHVDWTREATGGGSTSQTCRVPARNAPEIQSSSPKRVKCLHFLSSIYVQHLPYRPVNQSLSRGWVESIPESQLVRVRCILHQFWPSFFC